MMGKRSKRSKPRKGRKQQSKPRKWIGKAKIKKGALSKELGIPEAKNIPKALLNKIKSAKIGTTIKNPTKSGKRNIKVTGTTKKRATLALTLKSIKK